MTPKGRYGLMGLTGSRNMPGVSPLTRLVVAGVTIAGFLVGTGPASGTHRVDVIGVGVSRGFVFTGGVEFTQEPYFGALGTVFADVDGDGRTDAIAVNTDTVTVRRSGGVGFGFGPNEDWTGGPYFGSRGTFFADVDGDGRVDAIVVNDDTVTVRRSRGADFGPNEDWTGGPYFGSRGTHFADVTGDGWADAIVVNDDTVTVRRALATCPFTCATCPFLCWDFRFGPDEDWTGGPYFGNMGQSVHFADVTGDRRADAIVVNRDGGTATVTVRRSTGSGFAPTNELWATACSPPVSGTSSPLPT